MAPVDPLEMFAVWRQALRNPGDQAPLRYLASALAESTEVVSGLIRFALDPRESEVARLARSPLERQFLLSICRSSQRQSHWRLNHTIAPLPRLQIAGRDTDVLAADDSYGTWIAAQWLGALLLRETAIANRAAAVVTMRDDGLSLLEWIAHYRVLGFDTIFVYSNDNVDGSELMLRKLAEQEIIVFIESQIDLAVCTSPQRKAYAHALHLLPELWEHEWVFFLDSDEFFVPSERYGCSIGALLDDLEGQFPVRPPSAIASTGDGI